MQTARAGWLCAGWVSLLYFIAARQYYTWTLCIRLYSYAFMR